MHEYGVSNGYLKSNIFSKFKKSKNIPAKQRITDSQVEKLLEHINRENLHGIRQYALISLVYYCLLKISEALNLRMSDYADSSLGL